MIIKVINEIYIDVADEAEGEEASFAIDSQLGRLLSGSGFPYGEVIQVDVDHFEEVQQDEIKEKGLEE